MKIIIADKYSHLEKFISTLPQRMDKQGDGLLVHNGRNLIKVFETPDGLRLNVKRYHRPSLLNNLVYSTHMRLPKGLRAFRFPPMLINAGIETPEAVAYMEQRHMGLMGYSYFVSVQCPYPNRFYEIPDDPEQLYVPLAKAFATMTARMHEAQMLHRDYSPGNILWQRTDNGSFSFSLVDINRMRFGKVSLQTGCANFARLWGSKLFFETLARTYAQCRHFDEDECVREVMSQRRMFWQKYAKRHKVSFRLDL